MADKEKRGSEKLLGAWKARLLTEESVKEIASALDQSAAKLTGATVIGGNNATGVRVALRYDGDDVPQCGNDILFWLKWHRVHGGVVRPPRILIDGTPFPDLLRVELDFGHVGDVDGVRDLPGAFAGGVGIRGQ
jgi:hypothetical protein